MGVGIKDRVVQKIIALLKDNASVVKYTGSGDSARIYGGHPATIQDAARPCVSITVLPGLGRAPAGAFEETIILQIEPWMDGVGLHAHTVDDMWECHTGIVTALHRVTGTDDNIGIKIFEITQVGKGRIIPDPDGIMHLPTRWRVRATT